MNASFKIPTINIGDRQKGRPKAISVIDCDSSTGSIVEAIQLAMSGEFRAKALNAVNPYGEGNASECIVKHLKLVNWDNLIRKPFFDIDLSRQNQD